jgi:hypothetical protein
MLTIGSNYKYVGKSGGRIKIGAVGTLLSFYGEGTDFPRLDFGAGPMVVASKNLVPTNGEMGERSSGFLSRTVPLKIPKSVEQYLLSVAADVRLRVYWQESQDAKVHERFREWGMSDQLPEDIRPNSGEGQWSLSTRVTYPVLNDGTFPVDGLPSSGELQNNEFVLGLLQLGEKGERPFRITDYTHEAK